MPESGSITANDVTEHHSKRVYPHTHQVLPKLHSHHRKSQDDDDEEEEEEEEEDDEAEQGWDGAMRRAYPHKYFTVVKSVYIYNVAVPAFP